jgi:hypothetical protein
MVEGIKMTKIEEAIFNELTQAVENLGGKSDLLSIIGSFKNTLSDEEVLMELKYWNKVNTPNDSKCTP